jgi:hypothetical protein
MELHDWNFVAKRLVGFVSNNTYAVAAKTEAFVEAFYVFARRFILEVQ